MTAIVSKETRWKLYTGKFMFVYKYNLHSWVQYKCYLVKSKKVFHTLAFYYGYLPSVFLTK